MQNIRLPSQQRLKCSKCGKDPYNSGTGCLCQGPGASKNWVPDEAFMNPFEQGKDLKAPSLDPNDHGGEVTCLCGQIRTRASKNPRRVAPCKSCGAPAADAVTLITGGGAEPMDVEPMDEEHGFIPGCTYCKICRADISTTPWACPNCDGPRLPGL
mmetsp:Transcript_54232/g.121621  ORF Transcript_54232/g.121621 Transcript_54232/m.121621 type:complete len:156 (-) Transcript_54232:46-513(-)